MRLTLNGLLEQLVVCWIHRAGRGVFAYQIGGYIAEWALTVSHPVMIIHRSGSMNVQCILCRLAVRSDVDRFDKPCAICFSCQRHILSSLSSLIAIVEFCPFCLTSSLFVCEDLGL